MFRVIMSRKNQKGYWMWVPQKDKPYMFIQWFFV